MAAAVPAAVLATDRRVCEQLNCARRRQRFVKVRSLRVRLVGSNGVPLPIHRDRCHGRAVPWRRRLRASAWASTSRRAVSTTTAASRCRHRCWPTRSYGRDRTGHIVAIFTAPDGKTVDDPAFQKKIAGQPEPGREGPPRPGPRLGRLPQEPRQLARQEHGRRGQDSTRSCRSRSRATTTTPS